MDFMVFGYPVNDVNVKRKTNWKDPPCYVAGEINYFDWAMFKFANCKKLPEGR